MKWYLVCIFPVLVHIMYYLIIVIDMNMESTSSKEKKNRVFHLSLHLFSITDRGKKNPASFWTVFCKKKTVC